MENTQCLEDEETEVGSETESDYGLDGYDPNYLEVHREYASFPPLPPEPEDDSEFKAMDKKTGYVAYHEAPPNNNWFCEYSYCFTNFVPYLIWGVRHHCRICGTSICNEHCSKNIAVPAHVLPFVEGDLKRVSNPILACATDASLLPSTLIVKYACVHCTDKIFVPTGKPIAEVIEPVPDVEEVKTLKNLLEEVRQELRSKTDNIDTMACKIHDFTEQIQEMQRTIQMLEKKLELKGTKNARAEGRTHALHLHDDTWSDMSGAVNSSMMQYSTAQSQRSGSAGGSEEIIAFENQCEPVSQPQVRSAMKSNDDATPPTLDKMYVAIVERALSEAEPSTSTAPSSHDDSVLESQRSPSSHSTDVPVGTNPMRLEMGSPTTPCPSSAHPTLSPPGTVMSTQSGQVEFERVYRSPISPVIAGAVADVTRGTPLLAVRRRSLEATSLAAATSTSVDSPTANSVPATENSFGILKHVASSDDASYLSFDKVYSGSKKDIPARDTIPELSKIGSTQDQAISSKNVIRTFSATIEYENLYGSEKSEVSSTPAPRTPLIPQLSSSSCVNYDNLYRHESYDNEDERIQSIAKGMQEHTSDNETHNEEGFVQYDDFGERMVVTENKLAVVAAATRRMSRSADTPTGNASASNALMLDALSGSHDSSELGSKPASPFKARQMGNHPTIIVPEFDEKY